MPTHIAYSPERIPSSEDLQWYEQDNTTPSEEAFKAYREAAIRTFSQLSGEFSEPGDFDEVRVVYGDWTDERAAELAETERGRTSLSSAYAFHPEFHDWEQEPTIYIKSSTDVPGWNYSFQNSMVHEAAHQLFYQGEFSGFQDQLDNIIFEGHAMNMAKLMCDRYDYEYSSPWRPEDPLDIPAETIFEELPKERTLNDKQDSDIGNLFRQGEPFPNQEGYMIAYQAGQWILENTSHDLADFPDFSRSEREDIVHTAIEALYR